MFYYLLYNSSFSFIVDNRLFSTVLYGSILYILTHAILNYCSVEILGIINHYYWYIFTLDVISLTYAIYQSATQQLSTDKDNNGNLEVTFNLLKNKINTIGSYFNKKNELTITEPVPTPRAPLRINTAQSSSSVSSISNLSNQQTKPIIKGGSMSTPLSNLGYQSQNTNGNGSTSTPLSLLRENLSTVPDPIITENEFNSNDKEGYAESSAGSDLGSVMDLEDFEKSL